MLSIAIPTKRIGARAARNQFADLIGEVYYSGQAVIIERSGKAMAVMVPVAAYEQLRALSPKPVEYPLADEAPRGKVLAELRALFQETQALPTLRPVSEAEIAAEVAAYRAESA
jgi:prevent-host-death family protein